MRKKIHLLTLSLPYNFIARLKDAEKNFEILFKSLNENMRRGFTLIELLVTVSIISVFFFMAVAAYNNFNRGQVLSTAVKDFKSVLRDAQNRAISGEKNTTCTDKLYGWQVIWNHVLSNYSLNGLCTDSIDIRGYSEFTSILYNFPTNINILDSNEVIFTPVIGGVDNSEVCIFGDNNSYKIQISSTGEISEQKYADQTCTIPAS